MHSLFYRLCMQALLCNSIFFLSYLFSTLFGGLHAYFDKDITILSFLHWIKNDHDDLEDVKNYIGSLNKNKQYTLNYNDYLDQTNMGPDLFSNIELRNTHQSENNFVSNIWNFDCLGADPWIQGLNRVRTTTFCTSAGLSFLSLSPCTVLLTWIAVGGLGGPSLCSQFLSSWLGSVFISTSRELHLLIIIRRVTGFFFTFYQLTSYTFILPLLSYY